MARYAYDVNTTTRLIDVHKQFNGGLKTVDTDDALGAVFLRDAENVSISEFGFIEKRYGTYENQKRQIATGTLQGYWEFEGHRIYAINGQFFVDDETTAKTITKENEEWRYPNDIENFTLQTTRDMNAVNINRVLYIFTGTYPVYVDKDLNFYWFSVNIPTYDEIVVTGHNLLEEDYEGLYFSEPESYAPNGLSSGNIDKFLEVRKVNGVEQKKFFPKIPFANGGSIDFKIQYVIDEDLILNEFIPNSTSPSKLNYKKLDLDAIKYRNSGTGASSLDFINADKTFTDFTFKSNYEGEENFLIRTDTSFLPLTQISSSEISDKVTIPNPILSPDTRKRLLKYTLSEELFEVSRINRGDNFEYTFYRETGVSQEPYERVFFPNTLAEYETFLDVDPDNGAVGLFETDYYVSIIPYDLERDYPEEEIIIEKSSIERSDSTTYRFVLPDNLFVNSNIQGYKFKFVYKLDTRYLSSETEMNDEFPVLYKELNKLEKLETVAEEDYLSNYPDLGFNFSNIISGTYDFELTYSLTNYTLEDGILVQNNKEFVSIYFYDITITEEQLQDFPRKDADSIGIEYPTLKPIWTCNKVLEHFGKLMVWGSTAMPTAVFYSFPDRPTYFPQNFYLDFTNDENAPVEAVSSYMNILIVQTEDRTWGVRGNSGLLTAPSPYVPFTINPSVGTIAYKSVRPVRNHLFFLSKQGIIALKSLYAADEQYNIEFVDRNIFNIVPQDAQAVGIQFDNQYWLNFPNHRITLRWYIDKKAWVLDKYTAWSDFKGVFKYQIKNGKLEFITYPSVFDEENLTTYKIGVDYSLPTDLGGLVVAKMETSFLNQNYPFHPKNYKEAKLDFTLQNEYNISKDVIYFQEDITIEDSLYLDNVELLKNHRYRIYFYKLPKNLNLSTIVEFYAKERYQNDVELLGFEKIYDLTTTLTTPNQDPEADTQQHIAYIEFLIPNSIDGVYDIKVNFPENTTLQGIDLDLRDSTYDDELNFLIWVLSENNTLNQDPIVDYGQAKVNIDINLQDRLGDWQFGQTDFGKKVTAVNTIKLSGKGYNAKVYLEDYSKSKWTLESLGLTYKMKRARSR